MEGRESDSSCGKGRKGRTNHDATHRNERSRREAPLLRSEQASDSDVATGTDLSIGLEGCVGEGERGGEEERRKSQDGS
jgi:hypothetical protein